MNINASQSARSVLHYAELLGGGLLGGCGLLKACGLWIVVLLVAQMGWLMLPAVLALLLMVLYIAAKPQGVLLAASCAITAVIICSLWYSWWAFGVGFEIADADLVDAPIAAFIGSSLLVTLLGVAANIVVLWIAYRRRD